MVYDALDAGAHNLTLNTTENAPKRPETKDTPGDHCLRRGQLTTGLPVCSPSTEHAASSRYGGRHCA